MACRLALLKAAKSIDRGHHRMMIRA